MRSFNDGVPEDVPAYICIPGSIVAFLKGVLVLVAAIRQVTDGFYVKPASHTVMLECLWVESMQAGVALKQLQSNLHHEAEVRVRPSGVGWSCGRTRGSGGVVRWKDEREWWCGQVEGREGVVVWSGGRTRGSGGVVRWKDEGEWWCGQVGGREGVVVW